ncbi:hypothetical protein [Streptomyces sp. NPDC058486]|uniref:hypothetical protein n=1 Tax=unclassified Streptomyces TaxID=2593676 RepID=UPI00365A980C
MRIRIPTALGAALAAAALCTLTAAGTASAVEKDGWLTANEMGLYCNSYQGSSVFDLGSHSWDENLGNDYFKGSLSCAGQKVDNNTASYWNRTSDNTLNVFTGTHSTGSQGYIPPGYVGNASATFKNKISSVDTSYIIG